MQTCNYVTDMEDAKRQNKPGRPDSDAPDMRVIGIDFNPGPDAEERRRRLFPILVKLADDELPIPGTDSSPDGGDEEDA